MGFIVMGLKMGRNRWGLNTTDGLCALVITREMWGLSGGCNQAVLPYTRLTSVSVKPRVFIGDYNHRDGPRQQSTTG